MDRGGFDAFVGNPPFIGGKKITGALDKDYRDYLIERIGNSKRGSADLCAYFFLRVGQLVHNGGMMALLATNTIVQGDTRKVGLDQLLTKGFSISRAVSSTPWPGEAGVEVAQVWLHRGIWANRCILNDQPVPGITPFLTVQRLVVGNPFQLAANVDKSFTGSYILGIGFVLTPEEAQALSAKSSSNCNALFPYLTGEDLNSRFNQSSSRWVINFQDWPLNREADGNWQTADARQRKEWVRFGIVPADYLDSVAADYPELLAIVEEKVKPERTRKKENGEFSLRYPLFLKWWIYADKRPALYSTIERKEWILVRTRVF
jgi:hypothetical protein